MVKGLCSEVTYMFPAARYNVDCTKKINIFLLCNLYSIIIFWSRLSIVPQSSLLTPRPLNQLWKWKKTILQILSCPEVVLESLLETTMKTDQQEKKINRTTCFPLIGTVFFLIKGIRPKGSRRLFFLSVGYGMKSKTWSTRNRIAPTEWREVAHEDGRCYSLFRALKQAVCFVVISSLGFCKLLLQLGIFSYFQELLGNHSWHPCSLPEYKLLGTLFMSSGSCFCWHLRYLLVMSLFSCYCSDTEVG